MSNGFVVNFTESGASGESKGIQGPRRLYTPDRRKKSFHRARALKLSAGDREISEARWRAVVPRDYRIVTDILIVELCQGTRHAAPPASTSFPPSPARIVSESDNSRSPCPRLGPQPFLFLLPLLPVFSFHFFFLRPRKSAAQGDGIKRFLNPFSLVMKF